MTRRGKRRLQALALGLLGLGIATALALTAFRDNLVFFYSPSDVAADHINPGRVFRLGGMVEKDSVKKQGDLTEFRVTDMAKTIDVTYRGQLPDLFREGQGVVTEGSLGADGRFVAREVLAKHDEKYMPPEVANALKRAGEQTHATSTLVEKP
ncbi:MAG TPA: cytochrome c maturation protein CcmE [Alphaproteobacteria bacterium]|jgi:cytochrome c-type biogenesis protein CcmE|nr:cytochrome c maturation protein CcmE [Alphaproteobacteria bacterium]